jgi:hypothetical protein
VDPLYGGDLHRADMAWAKHAAGCGMTLQQIKAELLDGRDLGKKGSRRRQLEYAERAARKAIEQTLRDLLLPCLPTPFTKPGQVQKPLKA